MKEEERARKLENIAKIGDALIEKLTKEEISMLAGYLNAETLKNIQGETDS